jgi:methyl-accepting chemotaxis protein
MADMDWMKIVNAHVMWKKRLCTYVEGSSEESLDPAVVGADNQCALGKWIYGEGQQFKDLPDFETVRLQHAEFHQKAGEIVRLVNSADKAAAAEILHGSYSKTSEILKHRILRLYGKVV